MKVNIDNIIKEIYNCVERHKIEDGCYSRYPEPFERNEYGCADAANILYTIGAFPSDPKERERWIFHLRDMQDPETGMYSEPTHHTLHTTAHCSAALELFDAKPLYPCYALEKYKDKQNLYNLLENEINWAEKPWNHSHKGAGIHVCFANTGMSDLEWKENYFEWMWEHTDPVCGFPVYGEYNPELLKQYMAGGFHYFFNHESEHRPMRYPEKVIDSCLILMAEPEKNRMLRNCGFIDIDVVYCLSRAMRQTPYKFYEGKAALRDYAEKYIDMLNNTEYETQKHFNDLHCLFGAVCCLAELQSALPGEVITSKPLKLVLDRRPFI